jgi:hypothetical protein
MASNLQVASRTFGNKKSDNAYERAFVGEVASFETYKLDYALRLPPAAGGATTIDTTGTTNLYTPVATSTATTGEVGNVDNRYQTVTVSNSVGVVAGDAFTIDDVNAVHHITKGDTGQLKTFRVISVPVGGTTLVISPPIIAPQALVQSTLQYQNVVINATSAIADINWLNIDNTQINPFWHKDALEILPGRYAVPTDAGTAVIRATTDQGIELVMQKWYDINTMNILYRLDTLFGVVNKQPEQTGILLFNQVP